MTSASETASSIVPQQRSRRGRFANPFSSLISSKSNHISDYSIEVDEPLRRYGPGDIIKGTFVLDIARPLGITHIVVALFGYVEVYKNHSRNKTGVRDSAARVASGKGKRWVSEYYGDGFASLFEDEVVLCGEGRLDPKSYHFKFELDFPKNLKIPSSIDFERGTVTYAISATITRPTTMNPATTCNQKVYYREMIDVAMLPRPKPRVVTLEPVTNGSKTKMMRRFTSQSQKDEQRSVSQASTRSRADASSRLAIDTSSSTIGSGPPSPVPPSAASSTSAPSTARESALPSEPRSSQTSPSPKTTHGVDSPDRIIRASVQLSRAGCLPGDVVPVTVTVNHTKAIKSVKGVIATLFRQARVDMHPNLPLAPSSDGRKPPKYEDYYPRSKTGLGGLSLSAAGSSQVWRKDLSQTTAPLYVDPRTMTTVVKLNLRVPDDVFPTMRSAPGDMITFRYYVEVIVDIHGKLSNHNGLMNPEVWSPQSHVSTFEHAILEKGQQDAASPTWNQGCVDTASIRRNKSAITCNCELVIGSKNSTIAQGKRKQQEEASTEEGTEARTVSPASHAESHSNGVNYGALRAHPPYESHHGYQQEQDYHYDDAAYGSYHVGYGYDQYGYPPGSDWDQDHACYDPAYSHHGGCSTLQHQYNYHPPVPPPIVEDESALPEKERLRRAETRLLPSSPPVANVHPPDMPGPSAPYLPDENDFESAQAFRDAVDNQSANPPSFSASSFSPQARQRQATLTRDDLAIAPTLMQAAPTYEHSPQEAGHDAGPADEQPPLQTQAAVDDEPRGRHLQATSPASAVSDVTQPTASAPPVAPLYHDDNGATKVKEAAIEPPKQAHSQAQNDFAAGKNIITAVEEPTTVSLHEQSVETAAKDKKREGK